MTPKRLDKFLADATHLSRRDIMRALKAGRVRVQTPDKAGERAEQDAWHHQLAPWRLIFGDDQVFLDEELLKIRPASDYFILHKPGGILSTTYDPHGRATLAPWLAKLPPSVFPVGRLDKATTGLLLLIDDGDLAYCLLRPWFEVEKEYHLILQGEIRPEDSRLSALLSGVEIDDSGRPARALSVEVLGSASTAELPAEATKKLSGRARHFPYTRVSVVVDEGRNRLVRKMAREVGFKLAHLHRHRLAAVELGGLQEGQLRRLSQAEVEALWRAAGGRDDAQRRHIQALQRHAARWRAEERPHRRLEAWLTTTCPS